MKSILPSNWNVPQRFRERLGETAGRQRAMESEGHLLLVLHAPPSSEDPARIGRYFWRDATGAWKSTHGGTGLQALKNHVEEFAARIDKLEDAVQDATNASELYASLRELTPLARTTRHLHAALQQARELMPADRDLIALRDRAGELERAAELAQSDAQTSLNFQVAYHQELESKRSYEMAVASHRLNMLAALFFPIATISAIFGMNLGHGFEESPSPITFYIVLAAGLVAGLILAIGVGRRPAPLDVSKARKRGPQERPARSL
jgi:hypothetical protein